MPSSPLLASSFYLLSAALDDLDGYAARLLHQETQFGAMLDMLTDRCATMCLLVNLSLLYPQCTILFQLSMTIDVASHWIYLHSSMMKGNSSHKTIELSGNPLLRLYYTSRPVLSLMCAGNELFYCMLYLLSFYEGPRMGFLPAGLFRCVFWLSVPFAILKFVISLLHLVAASRNIATIDTAERRKRLETSQ
ncbi:CDP-diacylglycerol--inositol 3-phosphatidyltransferase-like [Polyodon spathula]|uniref:CDP-diacylglycerol--inositol 3-phosphatidyltransferase-like n=1 Tax=Polyodon spathula TaxID=7913 RepID=UPI001B7ED190|nr:CDP-diacylglycerol--inositol 3-phosphatidyltransferase-like [Polyodon spathula]XP_041092620.1 CDP-diacylglycerol--inositol 3-phosphatidyltransferase-like [Polyodon spathula]XP_041092621.1 CDP-diacylglycerol--inositol 3-phosphatidyltransferase-like [Polyodon spathula]